MARPPKGKLCDGHVHWGRGINFANGECRRYAFRSIEGKWYCAPHYWKARADYLERNVKDALGAFKRVALDGDEWPDELHEAFGILLETSDELEDEERAG